MTLFFPPPLRLRSERAAPVALRVASLTPWLALLMALGGATGVAWALRGLVPEESLAMVYLSAVLVCSVAHGRNLGILAACIAFITFNILFIEPRFRFSFAPLSDTLTLAVFLGLALLTGTLAGRARDQALERARRAATMTLLYQASRMLGTSADRGVLAGMLAREVAHAADGMVHVFLRQGEGIACTASARPGGPAHPSRMQPAASAGAVAFAERIWTEIRAARSAIGSSPDAAFLAYPLGTLGQPMGLLIRETAEPAPAAGVPSAIDEQTITILCELGAIAIERAYLVQEMTRTQISAETDRLRTALLSSISHDFRTPLSGILASVTALLEQGDRFSPETARELLGDIRDQTERINRYVANLLDMIKLEAGAIKVRLEPTDAIDIIGAAARRCRRSPEPPGGWLRMETDGSHLVEADPVLLEQAIYNVLDNARQYGTAESLVHVTFHEGPNSVAIVIADDGPGIPAADLERVFDKFYRVSASHAAIHGTGLGLPISRGLVEAMGGSVHAVSPVHDGRGTAMHIRLKRACDG